MVGSVSQVIPVDIFVAGCPPRPDEIINAVVACLNLMKEDLSHGGREWRQGVKRTGDTAPEAGVS
jgi:Ni,Fe-hydrogenase III small subunit